eukprot:g38614.t1
MTMKPGLLKQPGGVAQTEKRAAAADYSAAATKELGGEAGGEALGCDGDTPPPKGGRGRMNGGDTKAVKGSRGAGAGVAWGRGGTALVPAGDSVGRGGGGGGGGGSGGPGDGTAPLPGLEALHWGKVKKQQQQIQQPPSSQPQGPGPTQSARLKQIVLLQLDLIEQQQQQLQLKEREIDELKAEKETGSPGFVVFRPLRRRWVMTVRRHSQDYISQADRGPSPQTERHTGRRDVFALERLLARLERMERRMQLVKKENEKDKHRFVQTVDETEEKNATEVEKIQPEHQQITPEQSLVQAQGNRTETYSGKGYK